MTTTRTPAANRFQPIDPQPDDSPLMLNQTDKTLARIRTELLTTMADGKTAQYVVDYPDGRAISIINRPLTGGDWIGTHEDITERRRAERELERTKSFLNTVIENVPATIVVKELPDLHYALVNRAGEQFFKLPREKMLGRTAAEAEELYEELQSLISPPLGVHYLSKMLVHDLEGLPLDGPLPDDLASETLGGSSLRRSSTPSPSRVITVRRETSSTRSPSTSATSSRVEFVPRSTTPTRMGEK